MIAGGRDVIEWYGRYQVTKNAGTQPRSMHFSDYSFVDACVLIFRRIAADLRVHEVLHKLERDFRLPNRPLEIDEQGRLVATEERAINMSTHEIHTSITRFPKQSDNPKRGG